MKTLYSLSHLRCSLHKREAEARRIAEQIETLKTQIDRLKPLPSLPSEDPALLKRASLGGRFKDGGSQEVRTNLGTFYIDGRIRSKTRGHLYHQNPSYGRRDDWEPFGPPVANVAFARKVMRLCDCYCLFD